MRRAFRLITAIVLFLRGTLVPGVVKPDNVVVFYPTRYDLKRIVSKVACPVAAFFAEHDILAGATVEDARLLREGLMNNDKVRPCTAPVYKHSTPNQLCLLTADKKNERWYLQQRPLRFRRILHT